jgi:hypothetical protein
MIFKASLVPVDSGGSDPELGMWRVGIEKCGRDTEKVNNGTTANRAEIEMAIPLSLFEKGLGITSWLSNTEYDW